MQRKFVTSMSREIFDRYGKDMLKSFLMYWPRGEIVCYTEDAELPLKDKRLRYKDLDDVPGFTRFISAISRFPVMSGLTPQGKNYRFNVNAFSRKAFAQWDAAHNYRGYLFWVDADVITQRHIPGAMLDGFLNGNFIAMMKRKTWHACSSFVGWDCAHAFAADWWRGYKEMYEMGYIFTCNQWDDAFLLETYCQNLAGVKDIAEFIVGDGPYNVFDDVFKGYAYHMKGNLKKAA